MLLAGIGIGVILTLLCLGLSIALFGFKMEHILEDELTTRSYIQEFSIRGELDKLDKDGEPWWLKVITVFAVAGAILASKDNQRRRDKLTAELAEPKPQAD